MDSNRVSMFYVLWSRVQVHIGFENHEIQMISIYQMFVIVCIYIYVIHFMTIYIIYADNITYHFFKSVTLFFHKSLVNLQPLGPLAHS